MTWYDNSWNYRKTITISNSGSTLTDYQVSIIIDTASLVTTTKMRSDCGDIRLTDNDGSTLLSYWIESGINSSSTKIWIKADLVSGNNTVYMYYGNSSASSSSSGIDTFLFFDDFEDGTTYSDKWASNAGGMTQIGGYIQWVTNTGYYQSGRVTTYIPTATQSWKVRALAEVTSDNIYAYAYVGQTGTDGAGSTNPLVGIGQTYGGSNLQLRTNADTSLGISYNTWLNTYRIVEISKRTGYAIANMYDTSGNLLGSASSTNVPNNTNPFGMYGGLNVPIRMQWFFVANYASPEPTTCIGGEEVSAVSWLSGWNRRKLITITGSTSSSQTDYQMKLTVHKTTGTDTSTDIYAGTNINNDFSDLRFTYNDGSTLLNYWIESYTSGSDATVWIKIPSIPISPCTTTIYLYYDKPSATTTSNGTNTFNFFSTSLIGNGNGSASPTFGNNYAIRGRLQFTAHNQQWGFSTGTSNPRLIIMSNTTLNPNIQYYSATTGYNTIGQSLNINHPIKTFDIIRNGTTNVLVRIDDGSQTTHTYQGADLIKAETLGTFTNNWSAVRKYISPEPTFSTIGTEELFATPANITTTNMTITPSETPCRHNICTVTVNVTWTNNGGSSGTFVPNITIDTFPISPIYPLQELAPSANVTKTFIVSGLTTGTHNICPYPN